MLGVVVLRHLAVQDLETTDVDFRGNPSLLSCCSNRESSGTVPGCFSPPQQLSRHAGQANKMPAFSPRCGLIIADSRKLVPLQGISVDVQVKGFVADVSATLKYKNEEEKAVEAIFVFPMDQDSAVYAFKAKVEGKTIIADLQEKKQAHQTYDDAICQGQQAFLLEENEDSSDIFTCSVGNLSPSQVAEVTIKYVQELPVEADEAVRFVLPAVLNPRYTPTDYTVSVTATRPQVPIGEIPYTLSLSAHFHSAYGIAKIESNCDISPVEYSDEGKTSAKLSLAEGHKFDRDVEILIYYMEVCRPSVAVEAGLNLGLAEPDSFMADPVVMLSLFPRFSTQQEEATDGEFIFLIDLSGSMNCPMNSEPNAPLRIQSAKETLIILLKSLPLGCFFNIFGFGSHFASFFKESLEYAQESMEKAIQKVNGMNANFGGTEILLPLREIYSTGKSERPRQVFIFTDGEVGNTKEVIGEVGKNSHNHRCFTFGIGEGASTSLIKGMARAGGGAYDFITGKDRMQSKVLKALRCALQPSVTEVSLTWNLPTGLEASILSRVPTSIFQGQRSIIYSQLKGKMVEASEAGQVSLQYKLRGELMVNTYSFPLNLKNVHRPTIHRLAAKSLISKLEYGVDSGSEQVKKRILETSLQSGVISSLTAFVAVNKDTKNPVECPPVRRDLPAPAFGFMGSSWGTGTLFGSAASSGAGTFAFGGAPPSGTLFGIAASTGAGTFAFGGNPPSATLFGSARSTDAGTPVFGSAPSSGTLAFGSASTSGTPLFGSAPSSGRVYKQIFQPIRHLVIFIYNIISIFFPGTLAFGSASTSGTPVFGTAPSSGTLAFGSASTSGIPVFGSVPSSGTLAFGSTSTSGTPVFGTAPSSGTLAFGSASTSAGTPVFGSAPSSGTLAFGSASTSGIPVFGTAPSSGTLAFGSASTSGIPVFGSSPSSGVFGFGSVPTSGAFSFGSVPPIAHHPALAETSPSMKLILLQKADGSWSPSPELAAVLGISEGDFVDKKPDQGMDSSVWATLLAVLWLHSNCVEQKDEWELLSSKAATWLKSRAGPCLSQWVRAGIQLLKTMVDLTDFGFLE
ncbi:von Willebrand factor A domain-containing protein 5A-like isoform X3 [Hyla sarda]|uniref:von Willebrand factor A domain-containing protein 5A-like isoform X3 n=1 Tax=Hyla sarda TaxID=327740 RepID=UPI0024C25327|nr:von Willebrand factor A domain-containing protein 5A-like isoform X3 [Hyla sarda]